MADYYELAKKINQFEKRPEDNDMILFKEKNKHTRQHYEVLPSDQTYHDYYYQYLGVTKAFTLHDELINKGDIIEKPLARRNQRAQVVYGATRFSRNNRNNQPIFNNRLLNELSKRGYLTIYSPKR